MAHQIKTPSSGEKNPRMPYKATRGDWEDAVLNGNSWMPIETATPSARLWGGMVPCGPRATLLYGGTADSGTTSETIAWLLVPVRNNQTIGWDMVEMEGKAMPLARSRHGLALLRDGRLLMFGGHSASGEGLGDTWVLTLDTNLRVGRWDKWHAFASSTRPSPRYFFALAPLGTSGQVLGFGGFDPAYQQALGDTWLFNVTAGWHEISPVARPEARSGHTLVPVEDGVALLFGGVEGVLASELTRDDSWLFLGENDTWVPWVRANATAEQPCPRSLHAMAQLDEGRVVLFGGQDGPLQFGGTWVFERVVKGAAAAGEPFAYAWSRLRSLCGGVSPPARDSHAMARFAPGQVYLFGGFSTERGAALSDTWLFEYTEGGSPRWTQLSVASARIIPRRSNAASMSALYGGGSSAVRRNLVSAVLFGGQSIYIHLYSM